MVASHTGTDVVEAGSIHRFCLLHRIALEVSLCPIFFSFQRVVKTVL